MTPLEDYKGIIMHTAGKAAGREDKVDLEDFKVKAYSYKVIYRQIKSTLSIVKLATSL